jgi:hypothetical protein
MEKGSSLEKVKALEARSMTIRGLEVEKKSRH